jgi:hypothetical protein
MSILHLRRIAATVGAALAATGLLVIAGCGDDTGLGTRYPVTGTVTYKNQPVPSGRINFIPVDPKAQRPANGDIQNGRYSLSTATPGDGALPGKYKVTIQSQEVDNTGVLDTIKKEGGGGRQADIARAASKAKNLIPSKYLLPDTSGLEVTVEAKSNTIDLPLSD